MSLTNKTVKSRYGDLLIVNNGGSGVGTAEKTVMGGTGTNSALKISDDTVVITPENDNTTTTFKVTNAAGTSVIEVDTASSNVKVNGVNVGVGTIEFGLDNSNVTANTWHSFFQGAKDQGTVSLDTFGTSTEPSTSVDISGTSYPGTFLQYGIQLQHAIEIESVIVWLCGDSASSDNVEFRLYEYTVQDTGGTGGDLSSGTKLFNSSAAFAYDNTKWIKHTLATSQATSAAGKYLMAFVKQNGTNNDVYARMYVNYRLKA